MKLIRTALSWQELEVDHDTDKPLTVGQTPLKVANDLAARVEKLGAEHDVEIVVTDADDDEIPAGPPAPDLSNGVTTLTGTGDPVTTTDSTTPAAGNQTARSK